MNTDRKYSTEDESNDDDRHDDAEALAQAQISNARLVKLAKSHPPPNKWFEGEEEYLF